jgi:hypothetical protein
MIRLRLRMERWQVQVDRRIDSISNWFILTTTVLGFRIYDFYAECRRSWIEHKLEKKRLKAEERAKLVQYATEYDILLDAELEAATDDLVEATARNSTELTPESHAA